ncbi:MAG: hypothetical protein WCG23_10695 [bacterium]
MLSIIVFSKDRTLQLHGYLESLLYFSEISAKNITVLYRDSEKISYDKVISSFPDINWVKENNFFEDLKKAVSDSKDFIMFGCDDVIFKSEFNIGTIIKTLSNNNDIFGFSLRLGKNIIPLPEKFIENTDCLEWNWKNTTAPHWNYPWELDSTIYRKNDVLEIISDSSLDLKNPNYLEGDIAINLDKFIKREHLASYKNGKSIVITVNRVQDTHPNHFDTSASTDPETLHQKYLDGYRLDIPAISKLKNKIIHVGSKYFLITNKPLSYKTSQYCKVKHFFEKLVGKN